MEVTTHVDDYNASFRDTVWLQSFPLNPQTVMHYFALSPFYDRNCNNERLKMQRLGLDQLKTMRGVEYELLPNAANQLPQQLFVVRKQRRSGRTQVEPLALYYILDGTIYQAPNIHAMLSSRLKKCSYRINNAFKELSKGVRFSSTEGYAWDFSSEEKKEPVIPSEQLQIKLKHKYEREQKQQAQSAQVDSILVQLTKKHAPEILEKLNSTQATAAASTDPPAPETQDTTVKEEDTSDAKRQRTT